MKKKIGLIVALFAFALLLIPQAGQAVNGTNMSNKKVKLSIKQGGEWFVAMIKKTDSNSVLEVENVLNGWTKVELDDDDDAGSGQAFGTKIKMLDASGRPVDHKTDVDIYQKVNGTKTFAMTVRTDEDGWLEAPVVMSLDTEYYLNISEKNGSSMSNKSGTKPRIKIYEQVDGSDWFRVLYDRLDSNGILEVENVLPAKYKFKYVKDDRTALTPFTLKMRVRDEDGNKIKEKTDVKLYAYPDGKNRVLVGEMKTDTKGWVTVPGVLTQMKFKVKVD